MTVKTPIRTVFDAQNNATGLAEFQTGERVGISHGGTGLASVGTAGQVLAVNANTDGLEYVDSDTATINDRMQVANTIALANARLGATSTVTMVGDLTGSNSFSSNATSIVTTLASTGTPTGTFGSGSLVPVITVDAKGRITNISNTTVAGVSGTVWTPANNNLRISTADGSTYDTTIGSFITVANTQTLHTSITANLNSYIANTNPRIASNDTDISNLLTSVSGTNTAIRTLVSDRMQVANTIALANARLGATATVQITGDVAGGPTAFSGNTVSIAVTQQNNSVDLGTHTTGNYVATISGTSNEIEVSGSGSETAAVPIGLPDNVTLTGDLTVSGGDISLGGTGRIQGVDTVSAGTDAANKTYVDNAVAGVVDSAPAALDTLNELAAALGDDANFATTVSTNIGQKLGATATVTLTGDITGSASFSANAVSIATTYNNDVVLGTDTSGNYIASLTVGTGLDTTTATGEGSTPNITLDLSELSTSTSDGDGDFFVVVDASNVQRKLTKGNINISGFNNDSGYSTTTGTVTSVGVSAGTGLSGGGTVTSSGTISLALDMSELTDMTATMVGTDEFIVLDAGADRRKAANEIGLSIFNNDAGFSTTTGTVTSVATGTGLTGGTITSSGTISLATAGAGAGTYGSTSNNTKIDTITLDAYGRVTAVATGGTGDVDGVTAGTNLNGGGTSGTVTLNLDSALTSITSIGITNGGTLKDATGNYGSIEVDGGGAGGYEGYSIGGRAVFMHDNSSTTGLYNDVNNHWLVRCVHGGGASLYHNGSEKVVTTSSGANINGDLNAVDNIYLAQSIYHEGDTNTYMQFHAGDQWRVVTGGTERLEVKNSSPHVLVTGTLNATTDVQVNGTSVATSADVNGKAIAFSIVFG